MHSVVSQVGALAKWPSVMVLKTVQMAQMNSSTTAKKSVQRMGSPVQSVRK